MEAEKKETDNTQNRSTLVPENRNDAYIDVAFMENDLEAWGDFYPSMGQGSQLNSAYIDSLLKKLNIVYGIRREEIINAALTCNKERRIMRKVLLARGDAPVNEVLEYIQINPLLGQNNLSIEPGQTANSGIPDKNARVDYRTVSPFIIVKKDQALAKQKSHKPGKDGKNVHGGTLPHGVIRPEGVKGGENTRMEGRFLLSNINGQMVEEKKVVSVRESLTIKGPVGYKTGNIIFPGDVVIEGPVSDGFKIYSGGSITIKQTFDVTDAVAKGDLNVAGGIIGRGRALVKVGGGLNTKFIENCRVACRKNITVDTEIINSNVFTLERIEMGDKGRIVGGEIYAVHGIRAGWLGKRSGKASRIHCGIDFTLQQEKEKNNNILRILAAKLERLRLLLQDPGAEGEKRARMESLLRRLEDEQRKASAAVADIMGRLHTDDNAVVEVSGEIAPGTLIEICQVALFVTEPLKKVRIRLDKESGRLISDSL
ncbi:MAG: FapA family protein [Treponema sp.]|jgi:uncharacterized protein (DUF342 family)|nr:FapA family protein [Treponema sp.]